MTTIDVDDPRLPPGARPVANDDSGRHLRAVPDKPADVAAHDLAIEQALLGAAMLNRTALEVLATRVEPGDFYKPAHATVATALLRLWENGQPADPIIVSDVLRRAGLLDSVGGPAVLSGMVEATPATSNAARYARTIREYKTLRLVGELSSEAGAASRELDLDRSVSHLEAALTAATTSAETTVVRVGDTLSDHLGLIEARCDGTVAVGVRTGWVDLDHMLGGLRAGQLVTVAARTAMGKTAVAGQLALHTAEAGHPTLFVSIEMSLAELEDRFLSSLSRINSTALRDGRVAANDWPHISRAAGRLADLPLYVDDNPASTLRSIHAAARHVPGLELVIVDYLQLVNSDRSTENRQNEVAEISRGLKRLARTLEVPVVALAQINRNVESRAEKRPTLADLRDSGAIEQDSDVVIGLYRDEVYKPDTTDRGILEAIVLKQRAGPLGTARLAYLLEIGVIANLRSDR